MFGDLSNHSSGWLPLRLFFMQKEFSTNVFMTVPTRNCVSMGCVWANNLYTTFSYCCAVNIIILCPDENICLCIKNANLSTLFSCALRSKETFGFCVSLYLWMCREQSILGLRRTGSKWAWLLQTWQLSEDWCHQCDLWGHNMPSDPYINKHTPPFLKCLLSAFVWHLYE